MSKRHLQCMIQWRHGRQQILGRLNVIGTYSIFFTILLDSEFNSKEHVLVAHKTKCSAIQLTIEFYSTFQQLNFSYFLFSSTKFLLFHFRHNPSNKCQQINNCEWFLFSKQIPKILPKNRYESSLRNNQFNYLYLWCLDDYNKPTPQNYSRGASI